jgi:hypothetical protein
MDRNWFDARPFLCQHFQMGEPAEGKMVYQGRHHTRERLWRKLLDRSGRYRLTGHRRLNDNKYFVDYFDHHLDHLDHYDHPTNYLKLKLKHVTTLNQYVAHNNLDIASYAPNHRADDTNNDTNNDANNHANNYANNRCDDRNHKAANNKVANNNSDNAETTHIDFSSYCDDKTEFDHHNCLGGNYNHQSGDNTSFNRTHCRRNARQHYNATNDNNHDSPQRTSAQRATAGERDWKDPDLHRKRIRPKYGDYGQMESSPEPNATVSTRINKR